MKRTIAGLIFLMFANIAVAQEEDKLLVAEIKQSTVITEPATLKKGFLRIGSEFTYALENKIFDNEGSRIYSTGNAWGKYSTEKLQLSYGISNRLEIVLAIPYKFKSIHYSNIFEAPVSDTSLLIQWKMKGNGIGDMQFGISFQIIEGSKSKPSLTGLITTSFPTGRKNPTNITEALIYDYPTGSGEITIAPELNFRKISFPFSWSIFGYVQFGLGCEKVVMPYEAASHYRSGIRWIVGGNFNFLVNDWISIQNDLIYDDKKSDTYKGETIYASIPGFNSRTLFYTPGISFQFKKFRLSQGVNVPLAGKMAMADPQFILTLQYIL